MSWYPGLDDLAAKGFSPPILKDIGNLAPKQRREYVTEFLTLDQWQVTRLNRIATKVEQAARNFANKIGE